MANEYEEKLSQQQMLPLSVVKRKDLSSNDISFESATSTQSLLYAASNVGFNQKKNDTKEKVKARFRERSSNQHYKHSDRDASNPLPENKEKLNKVHQRLEFYERSLKAVEKYK
jgi:hypothetical protein